jgi:hypothetical protein
MLLGNELALASQLSVEREEGDHTLKAIQIKKFQKSSNSHIAKDKTAKQKNKAKLKA